MKKLLVILVLFSIHYIQAQEFIDAEIAFQTDPAKKYSLYIPSSYQADQPSHLVLGLHPWNTSNWNGAIWRDTLAHFGEQNNLIILCPDGGSDGQINDPIDLAFTDALLDSVKLWYNIDASRQYVAGFSWGGLTTYTYGLENADRFAGFIPMGAAINGINDITPFLSNALNKPFFIIHGALDNPDTRFYPIRDAIVAHGACVNDTLLAGVGHTVNFAGRNALLDEAYAWLMNNACTTTSVRNMKENPCQGSDVFHFYNNTIHGENYQEYLLFDLEGKLITKGVYQNKVEINHPSKGIYILSVLQDNCIQSKKIFIE